MEIVQNILETGIGGFTLAKLLTAIVLVAVCLVVVKVLLRMLDRVFLRLKVPATLLAMLRAITKILLLFLVVLIVMGYLGIPVTSLVAALSVVGLAVSLSVQNFLSNVAGGFQLLASHPFEVDDFVEAGGCSGVVQEIGLFYTKILTGDNKLIQLPNSSVVAANITNYTSQETRRVDLTFTASYDASVEKVEKVLYDVVQSHSKTLTTPKPSVRVKNYGASSIEYLVRVWCETADYWDVYYDVIEQVKPAFDRNGIEMTYDHLNVHLKQD